MGSYDKTLMHIASIVKSPYTYAHKIFKSIGDTMDDIVGIFDDIHSIGTVPEELELYYDTMYQNKQATPCDDTMIVDWGGSIGPHATLCRRTNDSGDESCPITRRVFTADTMVAVTRCGHMFELDAVKEWFSISTTCPSCRRQMQ